MGKYVNELCVATFDQKGSFSVVERNGKLQKDGGNVVTYFCTPRKQVIHFIVGPVKPEELHRAAMFASEAYYSAVKPPAQRAGSPEAANHSPLELSADAMAQAHRAASPLSREFETRVRAALVRAEPPVRTARRVSAASVKVQEQQLARQARHATWEERGELLIDLLLNDPTREKAAHMLLTLDPLPPLEEIEAAVFRELAGQRFAVSGGHVARLQRALADARQQGKPLAIRVTLDTSEWVRSCGNDERGTPLRETDVKARALAVKAASVESDRLLKSFVSVEYPLAELPALSAQFKGITVPKSAASSASTLILLDSQGDFAGQVSTTGPVELAATLRRVQDSDYVIRAELLVQERRLRAARGLLRLASRSPDRDIAQRAATRLQELMHEVAQQ